MMRVAIVTVLFAMLSAASMAAETSLQLVIDFTGNAERTLVNYRCDASDDIVPVEYLNAAPNFLAIMEVDGDKLIFASTLSGSGVRYVSGRYLWTTQGPEAQLYDETADPDTPLATCLEVNDIP